MAHRFKELKVVKDVETIVIFREENLRTVVINSDREPMPLHNCLQKSKSRKGKETIYDHSSNSV